MEKCGIIENQTVKVYTYGFELLISSIMSIFPIIILSIIMQIPNAWLIFLLGFIPERVTAGGYHASTPLRCHIIFSSVFLLLLVIRNALTFPSCFAVWTSIFELLLVYIFSPIEAVNKPLCESKKQTNRHRSFFFALCNIILSFIILVQLDTLNLPLSIFFLSKWAFMFFLLLGRYKGYKYRKHQAAVEKERCDSNEKMDQ